MSIPKWFFTIIAVSLCASAVHAQTRGILSIPEERELEKSRSIQEKNSLIQMNSQSGAQTSVSSDTNQEFTLWPGETQKVGNVRIWWEFPSINSGKQSDETTDSGALHVDGSTSSTILKLPIREDNGVYTGSTQVYMDNYIFQMGQAPGTKTSQGYWPVKVISFTVTYQSPRCYISTAPAPLGLQFAVSLFEPISINKIKVSLSDSLVRYGNLRYPELRFLLADGTTVTLPATSGAHRKIGRYNFEVADANILTKTVLLKVVAEPDFTIQGLDTYVTKTVTLLPSDTSGDSLDRIGKQYGFQVEWVDPDSTAPQGYRNVKREKSKTLREGILSEVLTDITGQYAELKVISPVKAQVAVTDEWRRHVEQSETAEANRKAALEMFEKFYTTKPVIYPLKKLTPAAAKNLVEKDMKTYELLGPDEETGPFENREFPGNYHVSGHDQTARSAKALAESRESVVADERANALIVSAIPEKQEQIAQVLAKMDAMLSARPEVQEPAKPARQYKLELVLLQGGRAGDIVDAATSSTYEKSVPAKYGITPDDLKMFGFDAATELGRGVVTVLGEPNDMGKSRTRLTESYSADLSFRDFREPYVILQAKLFSVPLDGGLIENTVYLEPGKPTVLGVTNLKQALILVIRLQGGADGKL